jgi:hypothetical protein
MLFRVRGLLSGSWRAQALAAFGTALKIAKQQQIDFHGGVGLSSAAVDHLVGVGYSFRLQAIRPRRPSS